MSQEKNSESALTNKVKRELTITSRVLEGELETLLECMRDDNISNIYGEWDISSKKLYYSIETTKDYLDDLRRDLCDELYVWNTKEVSDYIYNNLDFRKIKEQLSIDELDYLSDLTGSTRFKDLDLTRFQMTQDIVRKLDRKGRTLNEREIKFLIDNGYIWDDNVVDMIVNLPKVDDEVKRTRICIIERPDETTFEIEREVDPKKSLSKVRDELQKEYGCPYTIITNNDGTKTKYIKKDAIVVRSCRWKDSQMKVHNRKYESQIKRLKD